MAKGDLLQYAYASFWIGLFISGILQIITSGPLLLDYNQGMATWNEIEETVTIKAESATVSGVLENFINSEENPLLFDIVLGMINIALILLKIVSFVILTVVNYFLISVWLSSSGTPGAVTSLIVMSWQFWTLWYIAHFAFKGERTNVN